MPLTLIVLAGFGVYERLWTYVGQRDFEQVAKGVFVCDAAGRRRDRALSTRPPRGTRGRALPVNVPLPASVAVLFLLLMSALLAGARFLTHLVTEGRIRNIRVAKGTRDVLIVGAGKADVWSCAS